MPKKTVVRAKRLSLPMLVLLLPACNDAPRALEPAASHTMARVEADMAANESAGAFDPAAHRSPAPPPMAPAVPPGNPPLQLVDTTAAMLIRTGSARVEVDSLDAAVAGVRALAARLGGHVARSAIQASRRHVREASLEIRVPAARFDEAIGGLDPVGTVEEVQVSAHDVGEEVIDIEARLASARQLEQRLLEILRTRTGELDDVLAIERELARVRSEIEGYEGRLRYLRGRIAMSTLSVSLHEPAPLLASTPAADVVVRALEQAWRNFMRLIGGTIAALGFVLPLGAFATLVWFALSRLRGRASPTPPAPARDAA